jgi:T5SS/PEP-CTERM-associated repeat protein
MSMHKTCWFSPARVATLGLSVLLTPAVTLAVDLEWTNTTPGVLFYDTGANWTPAQTPTLSDNVLFQVNIGDPIIIGATSQALNVTFADNDWEFTGAAGGTLDSNGVLTIDDQLGTTLLDGTNVVASNNLLWNNAGNIIVGDVGFGSLTLQDGSDLDGLQVFVGNNVGATGEITLTGTSTSLTARLLVNTGVFTIGNNGGTGTVNVLDDADLRTSSTAGNDIWVGSGLFDADLVDPLNPVTRSTGTLNIDSVGSFAEAEDVNIGIFGGTGFLNITNGGRMINTDGGSPDTTLGANDGASGEKASGTGVVDGDGSLLRSRSIFVGGSGTGRLTVSGGGVAQTLIDGASVGDMFIGNSTGSDGKVAVHGAGLTNSLLDVDENLTVGNTGLGQLNIGRDINDNEVGTGALQVDVSLFIGNASGNTQDNKVVISGANATANIGTTLNTGVSGRGTFEARNGATITIGGALAAGGLAGGDGTILIDGPGTTLSANNLFLGNANAGAASVGTMTVSNQAVVTVTGATNGVVTLGDDTNATGTLTVTGAGSRVESTGGTAEWWVGGSSNADGIGGDGILNVLNGGQAVTTGRVVLGYKGTATGEVNVDGAGSLFDVNGDFILVGFNNTGDMNITNGGRVEANRVFVADASGSAGSTVTIDGTGSTLDLTNLLHVGDTVPGSMDISNGGQLNVATTTTSARLVVGDEGGADGSRLTVTGAGSRIDYFGTERISVGLLGGSTSNRALLEVLNGAVVQAVQRDGSNNIVSQGFIVVGDETGGNGQIDVDGAGSRIEARFLSLGQQTSSSGVVNVTGGGVIEVTEYSEIGDAGNGVSTMTVSDAGSRFDVAGDLSMGAGGSSNGTLNIADGGTVTTGDQSYIGRFSGSVGTANVGGAGATATWQANNELFIAGTETLSISGSQTSGSGTLNILANGLVQVTGQTVIKDRGTVTLDGGTLETDTLLFQDFVDTSRPGSPTFNFNSGTLRFTQNAGNTLTTQLLEDILGTNPTLTAGKTLIVDAVAVLGGPLRLNGGTFSVGSISAANMANVDFDAGTFNLTNSSLVVTAAGLLGKDLTIQPDQTINVTNNTFIQADGTMTVVGNFNVGGTITNSGDLALIDATGSGKTLNGTLVTPAGSTVTLIGDITFNDPVSGAGGFFGPGTANFAGGFSPGDSPGSVSFEGDVVFDPTNTLTIELGGLIAGSEYDQVNVASNASIDGVLDVSILGGFTPALGDTFQILTANNVAGTFASVIGSSITGGLGFDVVYGVNDITLQVIAALQGDLDGDGFVGISDLNIVLGNWNQNVPPADPLADPSGDGFVGINDLNAVLGNWNAGTPPAAESGTIPEPGALVLMGASCAVLLRRTVVVRVAGT